jgi:hypothetical protein
LPPEILDRLDCLGFSTLMRLSQAIHISPENLMKTIYTVLLTSTFLAGGAYAQSPASDAGVAPAAASHMAMKSGTDHSAGVEKHIADLHANLKITPAEESLWTAVAQTMRDNANKLDDAIGKREAANTSAVDDLNAYGDVVQAHADGIKKLAAVFSSLYASMPQDQKTMADQVFAQRAHEGKSEPQAMK